MNTRSSSSDTWDQQQQLIEQAILNRLDDHPAWPRTVFRLELETAGIYQDRSGKILNQLKEDGKIGVKSLNINHHDNNPIPFITRPEDPLPDPTDDIREATADLNAFYRESSDFSELTAYTALCKVRDEIGDNITAMEVLPSNNYPLQLGGFQSQLDGLVRIDNEYVPIEIYNGSDYLSKRSDESLSKKYKQIQNRFRDEQPISHPMLINRRSDGKMKKEARKSFNTVVVDTDIIIGCEDTHPEIKHIAKKFNLSNIIRLIPPLKTKSGEELDGADYITASRSNQEAKTIRPASEMVEAADALPPQYVKRIRGGVQLHYVNMFYRKASETVERNAAGVLQQIYNILLREGGMTRQTAIDMGWDTYEENYTYVKSLKEQEEMVREQTHTYITQLREANVIEEANGKIYARKAAHPQQTFSF